MRIFKKYIYTFSMMYLHKMSLDIARMQCGIAE